jgi:hypothetical protein
MFLHNYTEKDLRQKLRVGDEPTLWLIENRALPVLAVYPSDQYRTYALTKLAKNASNKSRRNRRSLTTKGIERRIMLR